MGSRSSGSERGPAPAGPPGSEPRPGRLILLVAATIALVVLIVVLRRKATPPEPAAPPHAEEPDAARPEPRPAAPDVLSARPDVRFIADAADDAHAGMTWFPGRGWAVVVDAGATPRPPGPEELPAVDEPTAAPLQPVTAEWRLSRVRRITGLMDARAARLETEAQEMEQRGDREGAARQRVLIERLRARATTVRAEIPGLERQVEEDHRRGIFEPDAGSAPSVPSDAAAAPR
jgi:hypothetical protein